jgi:hypothetical protein
MPSFHLVAANLWTRSIYEAYLRRAATPAQEAQQAKPASPVVEFGAVLLIVAAVDRRRGPPRRRGVAGAVTGGRCGRGGSPGVVNNGLPFVAPVQPFVV